MRSEPWDRSYSADLAGWISVLIQSAGQCAPHRVALRSTLARSRAYAVWVHPDDNWRGRWRRLDEGRAYGRAIRGSRSTDGRVPGRIQRTVDQVQVLLQWQVREVFRRVLFYPKPVQKPHPPLWIGGESPPALPGTRVDHRPRRRSH